MSVEVHLTRGYVTLLERSSLLEKTDVIEGMHCCVHPILTGSCELCRWDCSGWTGEIEEIHYDMKRFSVKFPNGKFCTYEFDELEFNE